MLKVRTTVIQISYSTTILYVIVKALPHVCMENTAQRGCVKSLIQHTSISGALSVLLYFLVVLLGAIFLSTQIASVFGDQTISKLSYNLFVVVDRFSRVSLASFSI